MPTSRPGAAALGARAPSSAAADAEPRASAAALVPPAGPAGRLYVVSTPIGNLGDVTVRALEVLRAVSLVAAEDTRHTRRLFARYGIETPLVSYHERNACLLYTSDAADE